MDKEQAWAIVRQMDEQNQMYDIARFLSAHAFPIHDLYAFLRHLFAERRLKTAYLLAMMLRSNGDRSVEVALALSIGGLAFAKERETNTGLHLLQEAINTVTLQKADPLFRTAVFPLLMNVLAQFGNSLDTACRAKIVQILSCTPDTPSALPSKPVMPQAPPRLPEMTEQSHTALYAARLQKLLALEMENRGDDTALSEFFCRQDFTIGDLLKFLRDLLQQRPPAMRAAFLLARLLDNMDERHWLISVALSFGGVWWGMPGQYERGVAQLRELSANLTFQERDTIYTLVVAPLMVGMLQAKGEASAIQQLQQSLLTIGKAVVPLLAAVFDDQAEIPRLTRASLQRQSAARRAERLSFALPERPVQRRRVVLFMIDSYVAYRLEEAMRAYGWQVTLRLLQPDGETGGWPLSELYEAILLCQQVQAELFVIRFDQIMQGEQMARDLLALLRKRMPSLKIVALSLDVWTINRRLQGEGEVVLHDKVVEILALLDVFWLSDLPKLALWERPPFQGKVLRSPLPHAGHVGPPDPPLQRTIRYFGNRINPEYWYRAFWPLLTEQWQLPVQYQQHAFLDDKGHYNLVECAQTRGEQALQTYTQHKRALHAATLVMNMTRKPNLQCIVTHRSFEAPLNGALLVQEYTPEMHCYFTPGEHYLEFASLAELAAIGHFIADEPEAAEEIRQKGSAFARAHYNDHTLIGYLDRFLWT
jgi:hypothetical protein